MSKEKSTQEIRRRTEPVWNAVFELLFFDAILNYSGWLEVVLKMEV